MGFFPPSIFSAVSAPTPHTLSFHLAPTPRPRLRAAPAPSPLPLPLELVLCIIEHAAFEHGTPDQLLLRHCALVCKTWSLAAQKLLFTTVILRSEPACAAFLAAIALPHKGEVLSNAVVRLRAAIDHNQPSGLTEHSFALAVSRCPNLYDLSLSLYGLAAPPTSRTRRPAPSFADTTLALLRTGPAISSLHFSNHSPTTHSLTQLLALYPTLTSLSLTGTPPEPPSPSTQPFPAALSSLRLNFQSPHLSLELVAWLTHNSIGTLRILEFEREPTSTVLQAFIDTHAGSLYSLALPACTLPEHVRAVHSCPQLRELRIENPGVLPRVWRALPGGVSHVAVGVDVNTALEPLVEVVRARGGKALRAVTVLAVNGGERHAFGGVLKMACAVGGVEMRVGGDVRRFRELLRGDPVQDKMGRFPREKSLGNIYAMRSCS